MKKSRTFWFFLVLSIITISSFCQAADDAWAKAEVKIVGGGLTVSPSSQITPINIPTIVNTSYGGTLLPSYSVKGELSGPAFQNDQTLTTIPNEPFQIPPLPVAGTYYLKNIRLMDGDYEISLAMPSQVEIRASNIIITSVTSRPMTMEEIQAAGIVINTNDYKVYRYTVGLVLESKLVYFDFPVLFKASDPTAPPIPLSRLSLPGPPPPPNVQLPSIPNFESLEPAELEVEEEQQGGEPLEEGVKLSGLLIFPNRITFLNQFFVVTLLLQNGAPPGSSLTLSEVTSTIHFPDGSQFVLKQTNPPEVNGMVPVVNAGEDGKLGTSDDISILTAGMQGQSEFDVTTPKTGTYIVDIEFHGILNGLPSGQPVSIKGHAKGTVVVRDPTFNVTFVHPAVVRQNEEYTLRVTLSNTSVVPANDVTLGLPVNQISGAALLTGQSPIVSLGTLNPGESKTAEFKLVALRTGRVTATSASSTGGTTGTIVLTTGVGDGNIPLSPDTLILPKVVNDQLPNEVVNSALDFLGIGWSLATAPPEQRPPKMSPVSEENVKSRAKELIALARFLQIGHSEEFSVQNALSELVLRWQCNEQKNVAWDSLRRLPPDEYGPSKGQQLAEVLGSHLIKNGQSVESGYEEFVKSTSILNSHFSAAIDTQNCSVPPYFYLEDGNRKILGDKGEGLKRDIPFGEQYPFGGGRLIVVGRLEGSENFILHIDGQGEGSYDLMISAPTSSQMTLFKFSAIPVSSQSKARVLYNSESQTLILENDISGSGVYSQISPASAVPIIPPPLKPIGAFQDLMADQTGRAVSILFNRSLDKESAEEFSNYYLNTREITGAYLQPDERVVEVRAESRISPFSENIISFSNIRAKDGSNLEQPSYSLNVLTSLTKAGGVVNGIVYDEDGLPLPNASVYLWEYDEDLLKSYGGSLDIPHPLHITQKRTTNENGEFSFDYAMLTNRKFSIEARKPDTNKKATISAIISYPDQVMNLALFMRGRGSVKGKVFMPDGIPAIRALVTAQETSSDEYRQSFTDEYGNYKIDDLPVGTIEVRAEAVTNVRLHSEATTRIYSPGDVASLNLTLVSTPLGGVKGIIKDTDGTPLAGGVVAVRGGGFGTSIYIESDGSFLFDWIPPCNGYTLAIYEPKTFKQRLTMTIAIVADTILDLNEIILPPPSSSQGKGTIEGHFYKADKITPVNGASVYIERDGVVKRTTTDENGYFILQEVPVGSYLLNGYDPVSKRSVSTSVLIENDGQTVGAVLYLPGFGIIQGTVYKYQEGGGIVPAGGVEVHLGKPDAPSHRVVRTDYQGNYQFSNVPISYYRLIAYSSIGEGDIGFGRASLTFDGQVVNSDIQMIGRGNLTTHVMIEGNNQNVMADVSVMTYSINTEKLELEEATIEGKSDATTGIATFENILGMNTPVSATNYLNGGAQRTLTIKSGVMNYCDLYLKPTGSVIGTVYNIDGVSRVPHAKVTLKRSGLPDYPISADENGNFEFELVGQGVSVTVVAVDNVTGRRGESKGVLTNAETPLRLDVTLWGEGNLTGFVLEDDGQGTLIPAQNANVKITRAYDKVVFNEVTDALGQFIFNNLEEGNYSIEVVDYNHPIPLSGKGSVSIMQDETSEVTITLGYFGKVQGRVLLPVQGGEPQPVSNVQVSLGFGSGATSFYITESDGFFSFDYVPINKNFNLEVFDQRTGRSAKGTGRLTTQDEVFKIDLTLTAIGSVKGSVFNNSGTQTIVNPQVTALGPAGKIETTGTAAGHYEFSGVPDGRYTLQAKNPANNALATGNGEFYGEGNELNLDLFMPPFGSIEGVVYGIDGVTPVAGAVVTIPFGNTSFNTIADSQGHFIFNGMPLRTLTVKAKSPLNPLYGGKSTVTLTQDGETVSTSIKLVGIGSVRGVVQDASGQPVEGFKVTIKDVNDYTGSETHGPIGTVSDGSFEFLNQRVGHIIATAVAPYGSGDTRKGSAEGDLLEDGGTLNLTITLGAVGSVRGKVVNEGGEPLVGAQVKLQKAAGGVWYSGTNTDGFFNFPIIPISDETNGGKFTLYITAAFGQGHGKAEGELTYNGQILDLGEIAIDTIPPSVLSSEPADGAVNVPVVSPFSVVVSFSEEIDSSKINSINVKFYNNDKNQFIASTIELSADRKTLTVTPKQSLEGSTTYRLYLSKSITDVLGNGLANDVSIFFTTIDNVPPEVVVAEPPNNGYQVSLDAVPFVIFSEKIDRNALSEGSFTLSSSSQGVSGDIILADSPEEDADKKLIFVPSSLSVNTLYTIEISGYKDLAGNTMNPFVSSFATIDTIPPMATISAPDTAAPGQKIEILADVSDNLFIDKVEFFADQTSIALLTAPPFKVRYTLPMQSGTMHFKVVATDKGGNYSEDGKDVIVSSDTTPPTINVTSPPAGKEYLNGQTISMSAIATDDTGVKEVIFELQKLDGTLFFSQTDTSSPYNASYLVSNLTENIDLNFVARARDNFGNESVSDARLIHLVYNHNPAVTLTSPNPTTYAIFNGSLHIEATATDQDGAVQLVDFLVNGDIKCHKTAAPYACDYLITEPVGSALNIFARATGDKGEVAESAQVVLTVVEDPGTTVKGKVVDAQGSAVQGATVKVKDTSLSSLTISDGSFEISSVPSINPITLDVEFEQNGVLYKGTKAGITPVVNGITNAGAIALSNLNDQSAIKGSLQLEGNAIRISRWGTDYAVVATTSSTPSQNHIYLVNVSDPANMQVVSSWTDTGTIHDIKLDENYIYIGDDGLTILKVETGGVEPQLVKQSSIPSTSFSSMSSSYPNVVAVYGNVCYVGNNGSIYSVDVTNKTQPAVTSRITTDGGLQDLAVWKSRLIGVTVYSTSNRRIVVARLEDPLNPTINSGDYSDYFTDSYGADRIEIDGDVMYVGRGGKGVAAFTLSTNQKPTPIYNPISYLLQGSVQGLKSSGSYLYASAGESGLFMLSNSSSPTPSVIGQVDTAGFSYDVDFAGKAIVVADGANGITAILPSVSPPIIDNSLVSVKPVAPQIAQVKGQKGAIISPRPPLKGKVKNLTTSIETEEFDINEDGSFEISVNANYGEKIELTAKDSYEPPNFTTQLIGTVPIGSQSGYLEIMGSGNTAVSEVRFAGNYVVLNGGDRVILVDVSDSLNPVVKDIWPHSGEDSNGLIDDIEVYGEYVYVGDDGLTILKVETGGVEPQLVKQSSIPSTSFSSMSSSYPNVVAVYGNVCYVGNYCFIYSVDVTNKTQPAVTSRITTDYGLQDLAVWKSRLIGVAVYYANNRRIVVARLEDPLNPTINSSDYSDYFTDSYGADRIEIDGDVMYVGRKTKGIAVFNLSLTSKPSLITTLSLDGMSLGMSHLSNWLYVATGYGYGITVVDTTNLPTLSLVGTTQISGTPMDVKVRNGYAYVANKGGLYVLKVEAAMPPTIDKSLIEIKYNTAGTAVVEGKGGAVSGGNPPLSLTLFNITKGESVDITGDLNQDGSFEGSVTALAGDILKLKVSDSIGKSAEEIIGTVPIGSQSGYLEIMGSGNTAVSEVRFAGNYVVLNGGDRVILVDVSDSLNPVVKDIWPHSGEDSNGLIDDIEVYGEYVYVGDDGLTILKVETGGVEPQLVKQSSIPSTSFSSMSSSYPNVVAVYGNVCYVGNYCFIYSVDVTNKTQPAVTSRITTDYGLQDLAVWKSRLIGVAVYYANNRRIVVARLEDPLNPTINSSDYSDYFTDSYGADRIEIDGDVMYVGRKTKGIAVFNLSLTSKPSLITTLSLDGMSLGMSHLSNWLYVATGYGYGITVVDTTNLPTLSLVGTTQISGTPMDVKVRNGYAYVANKGGLYVVKIAGQ